MDMKNFGCTHKRELYLDHNDNKLKGIDHILKKVMVFLLGMCLDFI